MRELQQQSNSIRYVVRSNQRILYVTSVKCSSFGCISSLVCQPNRALTGEEELSIASSKGYRKFMIQMDAVFERKTLDRGCNLVGVGGRPCVLVDNLDSFRFLCGDT